MPDPSVKAISFRETLGGNVSEFLRDVDMRCDFTSDALSDLVGSLPRLKEEGVPLFPQVLIVDDLGQVGRRLGGRDVTVLGEGPRGAETMRLALKVAAPLAREDWAIFIHRKDKSFEFGVIRLGGGPFAMLPHEAAHDPTKEFSPILFVSLASEDTVDIRCSHGPSLRIGLSAGRAGAIGPEAAVADLVGALSSGFISEEWPEGGTRFLKRALGKAFRVGHGALIAVVRDTDANTWRSGFTDCRCLSVPIDIGARITACLSSSKDFDGEMHASLMGLVPLLEGMFGSDGCVIMTDRARVLAFNSFAKAADPTPGQLGGARRRAFSALLSAVGVVGVFVRSQDGRTDFARRNNP